MNRRDIGAIAVTVQTIAVSLTATLTVIADRTGEVGWFLGAGVCGAVSVGMAAFMAQFTPTPPPDDTPAIGE